MRRGIRVMRNVVKEVSLSVRAEFRMKRRFFRLVISIHRSAPRWKEKWGRACSCRTELNAIGLHCEESYTHTEVSCDKEEGNCFVGARKVMSAKLLRFWRLNVHALHTGHENRVEEANIGVKLGRSRQMHRHSWP